MITIRRALKADFPAIEEIIAEFDLGHPSVSRENFWVAADADQVLGVANIQDCGECYYVSAVGVKREYQEKGVARALVSEILQGLKKDVYLYTKMQAFFRKFGFVESKTPDMIPSREIYNCGKCRDESICLCMVRRFDAAKIS